MGHPHEQTPDDDELNDDLDQPAHHPNLECGNWQLLSPPGDYHHHRHRDGRQDPEQERLQIGLIQCHPSLPRLAYTTCRPTHDAADLGSSQVVIQDYEDTLSHECPDANGRVVCAFFLRELAEKINDHRSTREMSHSLASSPGAPPPTTLTAASLGAVQRLAFLDREAVRALVPPHLAREDRPPGGVHKLLVGFRRCLVAVSLFRLKDQGEPHARGISVQAFWGPEDPRCYEDASEEDGDSSSWSEAALKQWKRQPSSFAAPVSEHVLAYGCYDGGLRFYDLMGRRQAKSALGPNGRNVPIVKVVNANPTLAKQMQQSQSQLQSQSQSHSQSQQPQQSTRQRPRILCASANGVGYLWELDLSVDTSTGKIISFDIPPPLATFDGLAAIVQRTLSEEAPTPKLFPIAPTSTHSQMDRFHSQFEPTFDPHRNILVWVYSSECIAAATNRRANASEDAPCGYIVVWDLSAVPPPSWPPPVERPMTVAPLPTPDMTCHLTVPGIANHAEGIDSFLTTAYIASSSGELMAFVVDTYPALRDGDPLQSEGDVTDCELAEVAKYGNRCYSLAEARMQPYQIFIGTQHGILMARIAASYNELDHDLFTIGEDQSVMELESLSYCSLRSEEKEGMGALRPQTQTQSQSQSQSRSRPNERTHPPSDDREDQSFTDLESLSHFSYQTQDYVKPPQRPIHTDDPHRTHKSHDAADSNTNTNTAAPPTAASSSSNSSELQRLKTKISKLELRNMELEDELQRKSLIETQQSSTSSPNSSASSPANDPGQLALKARLAAMLEQQHRYQDMAKKEVELAHSRLEKLENELSSKMEKYDALEAEAEKMRRELSNVGSMLEKERSLNQSTNIQLRSLMAEVKSLEEELANVASWNEELEAANSELNRRLEGKRDDATNHGSWGNGEEKRDETMGRSPSQSITGRSDSSRSGEPPDALSEVVKAAERADLRSYIQLLEDDKHAKDRELEEARFDADEDAKLIAKLQSDAKEQKLSIESLVDLLDSEKKDHEREVSAKNEEIDALRKELEDVQRKLDEEVMNAGRIILQCRAGNDKIASQREEIEKLRSENLVVRKELQDALDDLAVFRK